MPTEPRAGTSNGGHSEQVTYGRAELICMTRADSQVRITPEGATSFRGGDIDALRQLASAPDITMTPLFGAGNERLSTGVSPGHPDGETGGVAETIARMTNCYRVEAPESRLEELADRLRQMDVVEAAYVKPRSELARLREEIRTGINEMHPRSDEAPAVTPDFTGRQGYLDPAPGGVDARYAWTQPGGRGAGVRVIDCEWGWRFSHEDLVNNQGGVISGTNSADTDHGTAVIGEISGDVNVMGITGIAPDAVVSASSFSLPTATAIKAAADRLGPGDILLLEIHRPGPRATGVGQQGFIAIEWWPDDYLAIRYAVNKGVIVVEAAGNGAENLDDAIYDTPQRGFPSWWHNPFRRTRLDAGAIIIGAGAPPPGTHGQDWGPDRSRLDFSNHGACVDAQGWGREVTTTGYGDLQGGINPDLWYTNRFSGTSSASPIVTGALACTQGVLRAKGRIPLSPARARELLRATGSPQQDAPGRPASQRIGNRPDLRALIPAALQTGTRSGVQFRGTVAAGQTGRWFTHSWPAHWHVLWTAMPTSPRPGAPQLTWRVRVERSSDRFATYWLDVTNKTDVPVEFEARFDVLGW